MKYCLLGLGGAFGGGERRQVARRRFGRPGPRHRDDALVLRAQFSVGDRVEYRSDTHRQWLPGTV